MTSTRLLSLILIVSAIILPGIDTAGAGLNSPWGLARPAVATEVLYGLTPDGNFYRIDPATGAATLVGLTGFFSETGLSMSVHPFTGLVYAVGKIGAGSSLGLFTIDAATGAGTLIGPLGGTGLVDIAFRNSDGALIGYSGKMFSINTTTGAASLIGGSGSPREDTAIAFSHADTLYFAGFRHATTIFIRRRMTYPYWIRPPVPRPSSPICTIRRGFFFPGSTVWTFDPAQEFYSVR